MGPIIKDGFSCCPGSSGSAKWPCVISPTPPKDIHGRVIAAPIGRLAARCACISAIRFHCAWGAFCSAGDGAWALAAIARAAPAPLSSGTVHIHDAQEKSKDNLEETRAGRARREISPNYLSDYDLRKKSRPPPDARMQGLTDAQRQRRRAELRDCCRRKTR